MNSPFSSGLAGLTDISPYLVKGTDAGNGVTLHVGDLYVYSLLGIGPLLIIGALMLVKIMYARVKFFALEYGNDGFFGRIKGIAPSVSLGIVLFALGVAATWLGWQGVGYSVTLRKEGLLETTHGTDVRYAWSDATRAAERIKSTEFWLEFAKDGRKCRVDFQQRYIGERLQDKAIAITEEALAYSKVPRGKPGDAATSAP